MSYGIFLDEIKKGLPASNYLLAASEPFLLSEAMTEVRRLVPEHERDFNFQTFDLTAPQGAATFDQIIDVLNTLPFFSGKKVVIVEQAQKALKKDLKKLGAYLAEPSKSSVLVLLYTGQIKKEFRESLAGLKQIGLDISERAVPSWLTKKAAARGFELSDEAAEYLVGTIGTDLGLLASEVEKCTLIGKKRVEKDDIAAIIEGRRTYNVFTLVDAIRARDAERAFRIYKAIRETEEPYALLGALNWQYGRTTGKDAEEFTSRVFSLLNKADMGMKSSGGLYPVELLLFRLLRTSSRR